jgi:hypothetical protein
MSTKTLRERITSLLSATGRVLENRRRIIDGCEIHQGHDIHAYYQLLIGNQALHVQAYPGMSNENEMMIMARVMDRNQIAPARKQGASIGNEHSAVVRTFEYMQTGLWLPYNEAALTGVLSSCIYETYMHHFMDGIENMMPHAQRIKEILDRGRK